jgi:hypothetical protein
MFEIYDGCLTKVRSLEQENVDSRIQFHGAAKAGGCTPAQAGV